MPSDPQPGPSINPSLASTPAPSIHESIAASEIPLREFRRHRRRSSDQSVEEEQRDGNQDVNAPTTTVSDQPQSNEILASNLAPVDRGRGAITFLAGCTILEFVIWGHAYAYGAYQDYHLHDKRSPLYGQSPAAISAIGTIVIGTQCFVPLVIRGYSRTFPHLIRPTTLVCIVVSVAAMAASSAMTQVYPLIALQTIYGLASGVTFMPVVLFLNQWWNARRGFATGIIFAGSGIGGVVWPLAITASLTNIGFAWTLRIIAIVTLVLSVGATFCLKPRLPINVPDYSTRRWNRAMIKSLLPGDLRPMLAPLAGFNEMAIFVQSCAWYTISLYIATYCTSLGFSSSTATGILSAYNGAATVGYLIVGPLIDRISYTLVMLVSMLICSLSAFLLLGFSQSLPLLILFVLIFGLGGGGFTTFFSPVARDVAAFSNQEMPTIFFALMFLRGLAAIAGPLAGAALYNTGGKHLNDFSIYGTRGFRGIVLFVGSSMLAGTILAGFANWQRKRDLKKAGDAMRERWQNQ